MRTVDLIAAKRDGRSLDPNAIAEFVRGVAIGAVPDYQIAAFLMAVALRGMTDDETIALATAMAESGARIDWSDVAPFVVDKHSTGGVGDKTTLVLAPLLASLGLPVAKMSGRGLGFTGGTIDKLESLPGVRLELSVEEMKRLVRATGLALASQSAELAPVDGVLYALRDVTATVESVPLIAASVMSKKIAAGARFLALDVKTGGNALIADRAEAQRLGEVMLAIARRHGIRAFVSLTAMDAPLGRAVGNLVEVQEAVATLAGRGDADVRSLSVHLAAELLVETGVATDYATGAVMAERALDSGAALERWVKAIVAQGGSAQHAEDPWSMPGAPVTLPVVANADGWVAAVNARAIGDAAMRLGGGRAAKGDRVDSRVGVVLARMVGEETRRGEPLAFIHAATDDSARSVLAAVAGAFTVVADRPSLAATTPVVLR